MLGTLKSSDYPTGLWLKTGKNLPTLHTAYGMGWGGPSVPSNYIFIIPYNI